MVDYIAPFAEDPLERTLFEADSDAEAVMLAPNLSKRFALTKNDHVIGCPLCLHAVDVPSPVVETQDVGAGREPGR